MFKAINSNCWMVPVEIIDQGYNKATNTWITYLYSWELSETVKMPGKKGHIGEQYLLPSCEFENFTPPAKEVY